jgi:hypothetical protein
MVESDEGLGQVIRSHSLIPLFSRQIGDQNRSQSPIQPIRSTAAASI